MASMSVRARLLVVLGTLSITLAAIMAAGWISLAKNQASFASVYNDRVVPLRQLKIISDRYAVNIVDTAHKVRDGAVAWTDGTTLVEAAQKDIRDNWQAYTQTFLTAEEKTRVESVRRAMTTSDAAVTRLSAIFKSKDMDALKAFTDKELYPAIDPVTDIIGGLVDLQITTAEEDFHAAQDVYQTALIVFAALVIVGLVAVGFAAHAVIAKVSRPIGQLTQAMARLANRDWAAEVPAADRQDEIGDMARAVNVFKENGIANDKLREEQLRDQEAKDQRANALAAAIAEFEAAAKSIVDTVSASATEMQSSAQSMAGTAEETSRQATAVAAASEQASSNVQTVATAGEELSSSIAEIGRQVTQSTKIAGKAVEEATRTDAKVQGLADAAQKIGEVVQLINDIAAQTNLLALNATIEAARAGEAGKGFAVVASEVKSLANQTARATEDIGAQVSSIQGATRDSVEAIKEIGKTISEVSEIATMIASAVEEQGAATQEIARNVQEAARGTQDVSTNIAGVTQAAGEAGAAATQLLDVAGDLAKQAVALRTQVDTFLAKVRAA